MFLRSYVHFGMIVLLAIVSISIVWRLLTANYPTHSDVFFMGVEAGFLVAVLLASLILICFFLHRLIVLPRRAARATVCTIDMKDIAPSQGTLEIAIPS